MVRQSCSRARAPKQIPRRRIRAHPRAPPLVFNLWKKKKRSGSALNLHSSLAAKEVWLYVLLWPNESSSHFIYDLSKQFVYRVYWAYGLKHQFEVLLYAHLINYGESLILGKLTLQWRNVTNFVELHVRTVRIRHVSRHTRKKNTFLIFKEINTTSCLVQYVHIE